MFIIRLVAIDHREPIKSNNVTGFRINYNYDKQTGVIQTGNDIGDLITPSHSYTQGVSGTDNTNQKKRQIWYRTGSLYGHLRGSLRRSSGAGGARTQGQEQRSGGKVVTEDLLFMLDLFTQKFQPTREMLNV